MGLFRKTSEGAVIDEHNETDELRGQIEPLKLELAALDKRLQEERKRQVELKGDYDAACIERIDTPDIDLRGIREELADQFGLLGALQKTIARKVAELQPIEAQYNALREAQNERRARRAELEYLVRHGLALRDAVRQIEGMGGQLRESNQDRLELLNPPPAPVCPL